MHQASWCEENAEGRNIGADETNRPSDGQSKRQSDTAKALKATIRVTSSEGGQMAQEMSSKTQNSNHAASARGIAGGRSAKPPGHVLGAGLIA